MTEVCPICGMAPCSVVRSIFLVIGGRAGQAGACPARARQDAPLETTMTMMMKMVKMIMSMIVMMLNVGSGWGPGS